MLKEVKKYMCEFDAVPKDEDIRFCISKAKEENCVVELVWRTKWSGDYVRYIYPETTFEKIKNGLPKVYGL